MSPVKKLSVRRSVRELQKEYDQGNKKPLEDLVRAWMGEQVLHADQERALAIEAVDAAEGDRAGGRRQQAVAAVGFHPVQAEEVGDIDGLAVGGGDDAVGADVAIGRDQLAQGWFERVGVELEDGAGQ